jgi:hypothetical protein
MHLYATEHRVVPNKVAKLASVEVASQFAIDAIQKVEIELRGDTRGIVVGRDQKGRILGSVDAEEQPRMGTEHMPRCPSSSMAAFGVKLPSVEPGKKPRFPAASNEAVSENAAYR